MLGDQMEAFRCERRMELGEAQGQSMNPSLFCLRSPWITTLKMNGREARGAEQGCEGVSPSYAGAPSHLQRKSIQNAAARYPAGSCKCSGTLASRTGIEPVLPP